MTGKSSSPYYKTWKGMLHRLKASSISRRPSYNGVSICAEWLSFEPFKDWMKTQDWNGKQLDKDIIKLGNKIYCPEYCCFVSLKVNSLLTHNKSKKTNYPTGVSLHKVWGRFVSQIRIDGQVVALGGFDTIDQAAKTYREAKYHIVTSAAMEQTDKRIKDGLIRHANSILAGE